MIVHKMEDISFMKREVQAVLQGTKKNDPEGGEIGSEDVEIGIKTAVADGLVDISKGGNGSNAYSPLHAPA